MKPTAVNRKAGTTISTELVAGATTFLTMAYIIFVNAQILSVTGMDRSALIAATCLVSGIITVFTGIAAGAPVAMAPGMGLNAFFAYSLVMTQQISWPVALGIVFLSGAFFFLLTLVNLRRRLMEAIPPDLLHAIAVGIGVFIAFIGLQNMGMVIKSEATLVAAGPISKTVLIGLAGLGVMVVLDLLKVRGAMLIGIISATIISALAGFTEIPDRLFSLNIGIAPVFAKLDIAGALKWSFAVPIFTLMFMDLFDSMGTLLACTQQAGMVKPDGSIPKLNRLLYIDAGATMFGAFCGTSTTTAYIESAAGITAGGRRGLTSITTGVLFLLSMLFVPLLEIVPTFATAPALVMVGFYMIKNLSKINFSDFECAFPSFLIILLIALTYSISTGLAFGFLSFSFLKAIRGKFTEIKPALWVINLLCFLFLIL